MIKTRVDKIGKLDSYFNLPVTNRLVFNSLDATVEIIGIVTDVMELDDKYELTIAVWDKFVTQKIECEDNQPSAISISFV